MTETTEEKAFFITEKTPLKSRIEELEKLVTSLTKERDELKNENEKVWAMRQQSKERVEEIAESNKKFFKENHRLKIDNDALQSQLSNREEEIKELRNVLEKISELDTEEIEPNCFSDSDEAYVHDLQSVFMQAKFLALTSLKSEGEAQ